MKKNAFIVLNLFALTASSHAAIIHIPGEAPTIQTAYGMAETGDTLLIASGTYQENVVLQDLGVVLASEYILFADSTLIDSTILEPVESGSILEIHGR